MSCVASGVRWKALSAEDKAPYEESAAVDKTRYKDEMAAYKEKKAGEGADESGDDNSSGGEDGGSMSEDN